MTPSHETSFSSFSLPKIQVKKETIECFIEQMLLFWHEMKSHDYDCQWWIVQLLCVRVEQKFGMKCAISNFATRSEKWLKWQWNPPMLMFLSCSKFIFKYRKKKVLQELKSSRNNNKRNTFFEPKSQAASDAKSKWAKIETGFGFGTDGKCSSLRWKSRRNYLGSFKGFSSAMGERVLRRQFMSFWSPSSFCPPNFLSQFFLINIIGSVLCEASLWSQIMH